MSSDIRWSWRPRNSSDLHHLDVPLAVQQFIDNQLYLVSSETQESGSLNWEREDMRRMDEQIRKNRKARLCDEIPGLLSGMQWGSLQAETCLPVYIVRASISRDHVVSSAYGTNLAICNVIWQCRDGSMGLTFYNNHQTLQTTLARFGDGVDTPAEQNTTGKRCKQTTNMSHATQFLFELAEKNARVDNVGSREVASAHTSAGISIRSGHYVGLVLWKKPQDRHADLLQLQLYDLSPLSMTTSQKPQVEMPAGSPGKPVAEETTAQRQLPEINLTQRPLQDRTKDRILSRYKRRFGLHLSTKLINEEDATEPKHEHSLVNPDEFVFTVLGLPGSLSLEYIFSGVHGLVPSPHSWHVPGLTSIPGSPPTFTFYVPTPETTGAGAARPKFYCCDRLIAYGPPVCHLGINYRGRLEFAAEGVIAHTTPLYEKYKVSLAVAVDRAFRTIPDLAQELAWDILSDAGDDDSTIGRVLVPTDTEGKDAYRAAFEAAWRKRDPSLSTEDRLYPYVDEKEGQLIHDLGMVSVRVLPHVRRILQRSGAFPDTKELARSALLQAPASSRAQDISGYDRMKRGLAALLPGVTEDNISMRRFDHRYPEIVWDESTQTVVMREPDPCQEHRDGSGCMCWIGPYLHLAAEDYCNVHPDAASGRLTLPSMFRAFMECMSGVVGMHEVSGEGGQAHLRDNIAHSYPKATVEDESDNELGYVTPEPRATQVVELASQAYMTPVTTSPSVDGQTNGTTPSTATSLKEPRLSPLVEHPPPSASQQPSSELANRAVMASAAVDVSGQQNGEEERISLVQGNPHRLAIGDLLMYCGDLIQSRITKDLEVTSGQILSLTEERNRLEESLAEHLRAEEGLKSALRMQEEAATTRQSKLKDMERILHAKEAQIARLQEMLRLQNERMKKLETAVDRLEGRRREKKRKAIAALSALLAESDEEHNTEDEIDQLEEERPPRKLAKIADGASPRLNGSPTVTTPKRRATRDVFTPVQQSGSPRNRVSSTPTGRNEPRSAISPA
ncbi:hypothetical protein OBBRIDRAFT_530165 [Obba rivulosa]|uniref:Uncharacterized protein n=1 Tax=Obba rivulosa TaxID=1052685 RepID=A0A8E2DMR0_9APHY|nr:hypothetical protein OBBRIDRAFT_530165 [Obba rivulosa]